MHVIGKFKYTHEVTFPPFLPSIPLLLPSTPLPFSLPLEVGPLNAATGSGRALYKVPQRGLGRNVSRNRFLMHFDNLTFDDAQIDFNDTQFV